MSTCGICRIGGRSQQLIYEKYYDKFNFYFAKSVNEILVECSVPHVILYRDFLYFDNQIEFLKDYYPRINRPDVRQRVIILEQFMFEHCCPTRPNMIIHQQSSILNKRFRRMQKLHKSQMEQEKREQVMHRQVLNSLYENSDDGTGSVHDIYGDRPLVNPHTQLIYIFDLKIQPQWELPLWACEGNELDHVIDAQNQKQKERLNQQVPLKVFPIERFSKSRVSLHLDSIKHDSLKSTPLESVKPNLNLNFNKLQQMKIMQLMQSYSRGPESTRSLVGESQNNFFSNRGFQTDRPDRPKEGSLIQQNTNLTIVKHNTNNNNTDRSESLHQSKKITNRKLIDVDKTQMKNHKLDSNLLTTLLQQNDDQPLSPSRRFEIKYNLNRLILEQQTTLKSHVQTSGHEHSLYSPNKSPKIPINLIQRSLGSLNKAVQPKKIIK